MGRIAELVAGMAATIVFLLLLRLLGVGQFLWVALLALGVYLGIRWLWPTTQKVRPVPQEMVRAPNLQIQALQQLSSRLPLPLQRKVEAVCQFARDLREDVRNRPGWVAEVDVILEQYLLILQTALERYLATVRPDSAQQSRQILEELLETVQTNFSTLQATILSEEDKATAGELKALTNTMHEMKELLQKESVETEQHVLHFRRGGHDR